MVLALVDRGIPYDRAMTLNDAEMLAYTIMLGEITRPGETPKVWDWLTRTFIKA